MTLHEWIDRRVSALGVSRRAILEDLSDLAGVSVVTLSAVDRGARLGRYDKARALSEATGGKVTIKELCE
jgi:transcriptional regulator with XRE-family HTH domain